MTTTARSDRLLAVARDEWPALRWRIYRGGMYAVLRGFDRRGHRVVSACKWHDHDAWSAVFASDLGGMHVAGRTLRAAIRAARYAMETP
jgi:hypothetical protein